MLGALRSQLDRLKAHRIPDRSWFYDRLIPILFVVLAVVTLLMILFAIGVLTHIISWS